MPEFEQRVQVLRSMGYISPDDTVAVKGRVACEINSGDELVATEMIFAGAAAPATPPPSAPPFGFYRYWISFCTGRKVN